MGTQLTEAHKHMKLSISESTKSSVLEGLNKANSNFQVHYPGDRPDRQPVHTVYGGAQLFKADTIQKMAGSAMAHFKKYAESENVLQEVFGIAGDA